MSFSRSRNLDLACGFMCAAVLVAALMSLTRYPDSFDDEGLYAALGVHYVQTGIVQAPELTKAVPFDVSDGTCNREAPAVFGLVGKWAGYSLATARVISLVQILISAVLFFFVSALLGISGWLGALLFVSTERIFYAAHVFRPEASLVLVNTAFVLLIVLGYRRGALSEKMSFARGLLNAPLVMAHGNGLSTALINSAEILSGPLQGRKRFLRDGIVYFLGSSAAILVFYLVHVRDIGWSKLFEQLSLGNPQAQAKGGLWDTIMRDISIRWGRELIIVGNSAAAKVLRFYFYGVILATSIWSVVASPGIARRMALLSLGCFVAYIFVVQDKIDIHIAEMIPYFMASFIAWFVAARECFKQWTWLPSAAVLSILLTGLSLCVHHTVKYRGDSSPERNARPLNAFLARQTYRPRYETFVGRMEYWFMYRDAGKFVSLRYLSEHLPLSGGVIAIGDPSWYAKPLASCRIDYVDPGLNFSALTCP
ncbi:MAG: hypothetical protein HY074_16660 [Deltaproteobacteria bacterium]|nr:hypothetical protein [Deltaproteobacteria bacterium]